MKEEIKILLKMLTRIKDKNDFEKLKLRVEKLENQHKEKSIIEQEIEREMQEFLRD